MIDGRFFGLGVNEFTNRILIEGQIISAIISLLLVLGIFLVSKFLINTKLENLRGIQKIHGLICVILGVFEIIYLGYIFGIFEIALEVIGYVGVAFGLVVIALQAYLKNIISGIGIYLNSEIDIGDVIEINGKKGVIADIHLTRTEILNEDGERIYIPNLKFNEDVITITPKKNLVSRYITK